MDFKKYILLFLFLLSVSVSSAQIFDGWVSKGKTTAQILSIPNRDGRFEWNKTTLTLWANDGTEWRNLGEADAADTRTFSLAGDVFSFGSESFDISQAASVIANTAKDGNETHTGDVTGADILFISNDAVTTPTIQDGAVTNAKIASETIESDRIKNYTIKAEDFETTTNTLPTDGQILGYDAASGKNKYFPQSVGGGNVPSNLSLGGKQILNDNGTGVDLATLLTIPNITGLQGGLDLKADLNNTVLKVPPNNSNQTIESGLTVRNLRVNPPIGASTNDGYTNVDSGNFYVQSSNGLKTWNIGSQFGIQKSNRLGIRPSGSWDGDVLEFDYGTDQRWEIDGSPLITQLNAASLGGGTDDQTAVEVPITDSGSYFASTDVEGALQELGKVVKTIFLQVL